MSYEYLRSFVDIHFVSNFSKVLRLSNSCMCRTFAFYSFFIFTFIYCFVTYRVLLLIYNFYPRVLYDFLSLVVASLLLDFAADMEFDLIRWSLFC